MFGILFLCFAFSISFDDSNINNKLWYANGVHLFQNTTPLINLKDIDVNILRMAYFTNCFKVRF